VRRYRHYLALGDSISIDLYPGLDVAEREGLSHPPPGLGAASLLFQNDDRWPEFEGRDLSTRCPGIAHTNLTQDGATTRTVLAMQIPRIPEDAEGPALVTLTAGGNDLLALLDVDPRPAEAGHSHGVPSIGDVARTLERVVSRVRGLLPDCDLVVGTVYDPTDGSGDLGDGRRRPDALDALHAFNDRVREIARDAGARVAPIHDHFLGHGLSEEDPAERWYWRHLPIEPSARGSHEVRRLWWEAIT
jgi:lysophospholipase L1-like esterase